MELPSVTGEENGQVAHSEKDSNFEPEPLLKVGVQIQNLVKVRYSKICNSLQDSRRIQLRYILMS